jgi:hypothetical protein
MTEDSGTNDTNAGDSQTEGTSGSEQTLLTGDSGGESTQAQTQEGGESSSEGGANQAGDESNQSEGAPDSYEFTAPEGMEMDQGLADSVTPIFKELNLNQEQAGKLSAAYADHMKAQAEASQAAFSEQLETWKTELKNDQDFGGDKFEENAGAVSGFLHKTVPADLKDDLLGMLNSTGVGNHPALVKYVHHLSKQFPTGEDNPASSGANPPSRTTSVEERMYPGMVNQS